MQRRIQKVRTKAELVALWEEAIEPPHNTLHLGG
jgi:hypothetical protein